jgi:hypothetical protein
MHDVTALIPLYRSRRFFDIICQNVEGVLARGGRVIVSDQQRHDDCACLLQQAYGGHENFQVLDWCENGNWVSNINRLIASVTTEFFRMIPHDDSAGPEAFQALRAELVARPDAILSFGPVTAIDLSGNRLPERDQTQERESGLNAQEWNVLDVADLFWTGRFGGAFKGMVRMRPVLQHDLLIRPTPSLEHSERAWLLALALVGRFVLAPQGHLTKRYYEDSTHRQWKFGPRENAEATAMMRGYVRDILPTGPLANEIDAILVDRQTKSGGADSVLPPTPRDPDLGIARLRMRAGIGQP